MTDVLAGLTPERAREIVEQARASAFRPMAAAGVDARAVALVGSDMAALLALAALGAETLAAAKEGA